MSEESEGEDPEKDINSEEEETVRGKSSKGRKRIPKSKAKFAVPKFHLKKFQKHISILPAYINKLLDLTNPYLDFIFHSSQNAPECSSVVQEPGSMQSLTYGKRGNFGSVYTTAVKCLLWATADERYLAEDNKLTVVNECRDKLSKVSNLRVLVAQEIWNIELGGEVDPAELPREDVCQILPGLNAEVVETSPLSQDTSVE